MDYENATVIHLEIRNAKVTIIDPCVTKQQQDARRKRLEQAMIKFYKQSIKDKENYENNTK